MYLPRLLLLACSAYIISGAQLHEDGRVHYQHELPESLGKRWRMIEPQESVANFAEMKKMRVYFMLKHCKHAVKKLEERLSRVSDPRSKEYGQHLSLDDLQRLLPVAEEKVSAVVDFLDAHGVSQYQVNPNRDMIQVDLDPVVAEQVFQTRIRLFQGTTKFSRNVLLYRAIESFSLPASVAAAVDLVGDLQYFPSIRHPRVQEKPKVGAGHWPNDCDGFSTCRGLVTPGVLRKRYSVTDAVDRKQRSFTAEARRLAAKNSMAVAEFQGQYYDDKDLAQFDDACHVNVSVDKVVGKDVQVGGLESMLDIEYIKSLAPEVPLAFVYLEEYSLLNWAYQISADTDPQLVHSVSYGNDEAQQISTDYMFSVNVQLMKAGCRGLSILFASGDQGVCGREGCGFLRRRYKPDFPAGSPYVTAVGGTDFLTYEIGEEKAWSCGGGGFSDTFDLPDFQKEAVQRYKEIAPSLPPSRVWNSTSRGYPDVSALGGQKTPYCIIARGIPMGIAGTSASAPVVSAIFAKLNGVRLAAGKPPLGFLNPFIYQNMDAFNDVTHGANGCSTFTKGFMATKGWDPATGVGTPNYAKLKSKVMAMAN